MLLIKGGDETLYMHTQAYPQIRENLEITHYKSMSKIEN